SRRHVQLPLTENRICSQTGRQRKEEERLMRGPSAGWIGILLLTVGILGGAAAPLRAQGSFGIAAGLYQPDDDDLDREGVFGLRGGYRFHNDFGLEGSLSRVELVNGVPGGSQIPGIDFDLEVNLYNLDVSLQWFPRFSHGGLIVFGGPGVARLDSKA